MMSQFAWSQPMESSSERTLAPLKQITKGIEPEKVTCFNNLVLVTNLSKMTVACVKQTSVVPLFQRGWVPVTETGSDILLTWSQSLPQDSPIKIRGWTVAWGTGGDERARQSVGALDCKKGGSMTVDVLIGGGAKDNIITGSVHCGDKQAQAQAVDPGDGSVDTKHDEARQDSGDYSCVANPTVRATPPVSNWRVLCQLFDS